ncbi:succinyldiaminopimelate transaminase [Arcanobacterium haemolyticum]|nr:succinyldiaminopimelate transaminase [Arcanobacterium haemolyticum]
MGLYGNALPDFPWDSLVPVRQRAAQHPRGAVDLTIGTPVDPVPAAIQEALVRSADSPGYPPTIGTPGLREAIVEWLARRRGVEGEPGVLPTIGSKECVALLPSLLGLGQGDVVAFPRVAYPTYDVGARLAGATPRPLDPESDPATWPEDISLLWLNSPGNPDGHVLRLEHLRNIVSWARERGVLVASDECYAELIWDVDESPSILDSRVCGGDYTGLFCLYSLSKQSNLAGYRAAFVAGDPQRIGAITEIRKHAGFLMPGPVQQAMSLALRDDTHVTAQREVYRARRDKLSLALENAGLINDENSVAGLYMWARDAAGRASGQDIVRACAELGIIVTPGDFYGEAGVNNVRISLTATDEAIDEAVRRLPELPALLH